MTGNYRTVYAFAREMHPRTSDLFIQYGTAGFRTKAMYLDHVLYRMGLLAALRSRVKNGATIGVMITASHNLEPDNGVKLIDPHGEMLEMSWESIATKLANVSDNELEQAVAEIVDMHKIDMRLKANVYIGMDSRYTSPGLAKAATDGVLAIQGTPKDFGITTTPMLHFFVMCRNTNGRYGLPTEEGYFSKLFNAFKNLRYNESSNAFYKPELYFDGANGVGGKKMRLLKKRLKGYLDVEIFNAGGNGGKLNLNCGADFVKVHQKPPVDVPIKLNQRVASVDGDADRIVYYYLDNSETFHLLDGDRIATLLAGYLMGLIKKCQLSDLKLGLVQTAYANGGSTEYITETLCVPVTCVKTGVKYLHHAALDYDIGVYFEANGHGTVIYSDKAKNLIRYATMDTSLNEVQKEAAHRMLAIVDLTNETVGDAISDMFLVETVLQSNGWDVHQWLQAYEDLPCRQLKVSVKDRNIVTTTDAERKCVSPEGLQERIDELVSKYAKGRAFVRASGTEDIVRVYAETTTKEDTEKLAAEVAIAVFEIANGVGNPPQLPMAAQ